MHINTNGDELQIHWKTVEEEEEEMVQNGRVQVMWWEEGDNDWLEEQRRESEGEPTGGWGMDEGRRRRGEINMALIVSSAPLPSLDQPFITQRNQSSVDTLANEALALLSLHPLRQQQHM